MPSHPQHTFTPLERIPKSEIVYRQQRCRALLKQYCPEADGLLISSKLHIYHLSGTLGTGLLWLPLEGEPVLFIRKGTERAELESQLTHILPFTSYRELSELAKSVASPLGQTLAVDKQNFSWAMFDMLSKRLPNVTFVGGDQVLAYSRAVKTAWEQERMRQSGRIHALVLDQNLPERISVGMKESDIAFTYIRESLRLGSDGYSRMNAHGEEMFFGYASCGSNGLYPTGYNGPLGCRGLHPTTPFLGSRDVVWQPRQLLSIDMACQKGGYNTDRTQTYWSGIRATIPNAILDAQQVCAEILAETSTLLKPGCTPSQLWKKAVEIASRLGYTEQFMGLGRDRVPFLGHGIGLTIDEWPAIAKSFTMPFEAGMTIALEPKISVPGLGMPGIEHTYLITETGAEPLTGTNTQIITVS